MPHVGTSSGEQLKLREFLKTPGLLMDRELDCAL
jgi:hypothetical protein